MKRTIFSIYFAVWCTLQALSQGISWNKTYQDYFDLYGDVAVEQMSKYGIPASITLAQGVLESGAGKSELARKGNNHFGIKCNGWTGRKTYHDDDERNECFRAYKNAYESYVDHSVFLTTSQRYSRLFQLKRTDYKGWAHGLKACCYATNPQYAYRLIDIIELYKLHQYDKATHANKFIAGHAGAHSVGAAELHPIHINNRNYYLQARRGETFKMIGKEVGISGRRLARYNERPYKEPLEEGDIVYLKKKRTSADKSFKRQPHIVKAGESMYTISQKYGVRLKSLYRMNRMEPDHQLRVGEQIRVR